MEKKEEKLQPSQQTPSYVWRHFTRIARLRDRDDKFVFP